MILVVLIRLQFETEDSDSDDTAVSKYSSSDSDRYSDTEAMGGIDSDKADYTNWCSCDICIMHLAVK